MRFIQSRLVIARGVWLALLVSLPLDPLLLGAFTRLQGESRTSCSLLSAILLSASLIFSSSELQLSILQLLRTIQSSTFSASNYKPVLICFTALLILAVIEFLLSLSHANRASLIIGSWIFVAAIITIFQQLRTNRALVKKEETSRLLLVHRLAQQDLILLLLPSICIRLASFSLTVDNQSPSDGAYLPILTIAVVLLLITYPTNEQLIIRCCRCKQSRLRLFTERGGCARCLAQEKTSLRVTIDRKGHRALHPLWQPYVHSKSGVIESAAKSVLVSFLKKSEKPLAFLARLSTHRLSRR